MSEIAPAPGEPITASFLQSLVDRIAALEESGDSGHGSPILEPPEEHDPPILAKITSTTGALLWSEAGMDGSGNAKVASGPSALSGTSATAGAAIRLPTPFQILFPFHTATAAQFVTMVNVFFVLVQQSGGTDGSATAPASWTYNVYDLADTGFTTPLTASPLAQQRARPYGSMQTGKKFGVCFYDGSGNFSLWDAGEVPNMVVCG